MISWQLLFSHACDTLASLINFPISLSLCVNVSILAFLFFSFFFFCLFQFFILFWFSFLIFLNCLFFLVCFFYYSFLLRFYFDFFFVFVYRYIFLFYLLLFFIECCKKDRKRWGKWVCLYFRFSIIQDGRVVVGSVHFASCRRWRSWFRPR